jgi:hypothetical protein
MSRYGGLTSYRGYHQLKILFIAKQIIVFVLFTNFTMVYTPDFSGVTQSLVLYVCFVDHCLSFCAFSFGHCVVCSSLIYGF